MASIGTVYLFKRYSGSDDRTYWYAEYTCDSAGSAFTRCLGDTISLKGTPKQLQYFADLAFQGEDYHPRQYIVE